MKIKNIKVEGLNGSKQTIELQFHDDLNVITGKNGSGKTTILKLIWYCISANIERAVREIVFSNVYLETSKYTLEIKIKNKDENEKKIVECIIKIDGEIIFNKEELAHDGRFVDEANSITSNMFDASIFFPTFRRIEGGFSMDFEDGRRKRIFQDGHEVHFRHEGNEGFGHRIQNALEDHSGRLSIANHKFVSSISTVDIKRLITKKHVEATDNVNSFSEEISKKIFDIIRAYKQEKGIKNTLDSAILTLDKIHNDVAELEEKRSSEFNALSVLSKIITEIFNHKGILIAKKLALGELEDAINSDVLSAGEKQMLGFLCYNALFKNCPFFIDEPELSLHIDWQRMLLNVLLEQGTGNQLFIATHSPFIYSQFEDKEFIISYERGL